MKFVFQGVHEQINFGPAKEPWKPDKELMNKIVFIHKGLNHKELIKGLQECLYNDDDEEE